MSHFHLFEKKSSFLLRLPKIQAWQWQRLHRQYKEIPGLLLFSLWLRLGNCLLSFLAKKCDQPATSDKLNTSISNFSFSGHLLPKLSRSLEIYDKEAPFFIYWFEYQRKSFPLFSKETTFKHGFRSPLEVMRSFSRTYCEQRLKTRPTWQCNTKPTLTYYTLFFWTGRKLFW